MSGARVLIADDHALLLDGLRRLLQRKEFEVLGTYENGQMLVQAAQELFPDVILLDISMPVLNGYEAAMQIRQSVPSVQIIFISMHTEPEYIRDAFRAGASGYIDKRCNGEELVFAIHEVLEGRRYITPRLRIGLEAESLKPTKPELVLPPLTTRQREVLQLVAAGRSEKEIASALHVCEKTVEFHKASIRRQLSLRSTADMVRYAIRHGLACE